MTDPNKSNEPEAFSVSELSQKLKRTLEQQFDFVRVRGELSKVKIHSSGHLYTDLKDENALINAICWRGTVAQLGLVPEEGMEVICTGKITTYPARSNYQLIIESMTLAGQGALLKMLEDRKKRLAAEGLFAPSRKRRLPFVPRKIGIITSPTGAVIKDILHRLQDRYPLPVIFWPAAVQGENTVRDVVAGIAAFNALPPGDRPDVLIIARGGGSFEDLMPFNDEAIVRAVVASDIPIISAIGHETDLTLIDHAADLRAPTPTAAAEMATPVRADMIYTFNMLQQQCLKAIQERIKHNTMHLRQLHSALGDPERILHTQWQRLDLNVAHMRQALQRQTHALQTKFLRLAGGLRHPQTHIDQARQRLGFVTQNLVPAIQRLVEQQTKRNDNNGALLESYSFKRVLARGYAVIKDKQGSVITSAATAQKTAPMDIVLADGVVTVTPIAS